MASRSQSAKSAFTVPELLFILLILALVAAFFLPALARAKAKSSHVKCINNAKDIGLAYRIFATDSDRFPFEISTNQGGTKEFASDIVAQYRCLSNELSTPLILICPDRGPWPGDRYARDWKDLTRTKIDYFICLTASKTKVSSLLTGDSGFLVNGRPASNQITISANDRVSYPRNLHNNSRPTSIGFSDGLVEYFSAQKHRSAFSGNLILEP